MKQVLIPTFKFSHAIKIVTKYGKKSADVCAKSGIYIV